MVVSFVSDALERKFGGAQILPCAFAAERPGKARHKVAGRGGSPDVYGDIKCHSIYPAIAWISWIYSGTSCSCFLSESEKISCGGAVSDLFYHWEFLCDQSGADFGAAPHLLSNHAVPVYLCPRDFTERQVLPDPADFVCENPSRRVQTLPSAGAGLQELCTAPLAGAQGVSAGGGKEYLEAISGELYGSPISRVVCMACVEGLRARAPA